MIAGIRQESTIWVCYTERFQSRDSDRYAENGSVYSVGWADIRHSNA
jgi:hypothetical protein